MAIDYGNSYTDKKTQSSMMKVLKLSNTLTGSRRLGAKKPKTQLNSDAKPKTDFYDDPSIIKANKGAAKGVNYDERLSITPKKITKRNESQQNDYKPRSKKATGRPKNISKVNREYK